MAKKRKIKTFSFQGNDNRHYRLTEQYTAAVDALFSRATKGISDVAAKENYNPENPFSFNDYPKIKKQAQKIINGLAGNITAVISDGSRRQWLYACQKNDEFVASIMDTSKLNKAQLNKMQDRNLDALQTFQKRKVDGMDLSQRVWKYVGQYKDQIEQGLDVGLGDGVSAQRLSKDLRQNLQDPDRLFRRVRDKRGNLQLSKAAKAFHPGQGVYRSSTKNAMRLTRSEINMSYREADWLRWQQLDFVVGFEIRVSNRHEEWLKKVKFKGVEICDQLKGKYPKTFKFKGWHPQCLCYVVPILQDEESFRENRVSRFKAAINGTEYKKYAAKNAVTDVPQGFKDWVAENAGKQANWGSTPYFVRDNFVNGTLADGLKYVAPAKLIKPIKTEQQKADIQRRWDERAKIMNANSKFDEVIQILDKSKIDYNEVNTLNKQLDEFEIISRVGGGDMTKGSCSSLAFAYAGNKSGLDVLDFRDGPSREKFSSSFFILDIAKKSNGVIESHINDFTKANNLLKQVETGKEYYFTCGSHAAIVRKTATGYEYLELQSAIKNGFKPLTTNELKNRFAAKRSHSISGIKFETQDCIIDIELLKSDTSFRKLLGYINTKESEQKKGIKGTIK